MVNEPIRLRSASSDGPRERLVRSGGQIQAGAAVVVGVGWLGGVILRLCSFLFRTIYAVDPDVCTKATPLAGISEGDDLGTPKVRAAARWARRRGAARVIPVTEHVQRLGLGFWRHAARGGARAWCALDNPFAAASAAEACRSAGLAAITANMHVDRGVVRVFPGRQAAACYACLATGLTRDRQGCLDPRLSRAAEPTIAAPGVPEAVGALAVQHGLGALESVSESYEIRWHRGGADGLPGASRYALARSRKCPRPHASGEALRLVQMSARSGEVSLADVREAGEYGRNARVLLPGGRLASRLQCSRRCGAAPVETLRVASTLTDQDRCERCGGELVPDRYAAASWTGLEPAVRGKTLRDLFMPLWPVLRVEGPDGAAEVEVAGDREDVLPEVPDA